MDDEDVVFEGSPLHGYLKETGCDDINLEKRNKNVNKNETQDNSLKDVRKISGQKSKEELKQGCWAYMKKQLKNYIYDDIWKKQIINLHKRCSDKIMNSSLNQPLMSPDDALYVENFSLSLDDGFSSVSEKSLSKSSLYGHFFLQISVLVVTISYALLRMFHFKTSPQSSPFHQTSPPSPPINQSSSNNIIPTSPFVYALDLFSLVVTIAALLPASLKFSATGKTVGRLDGVEKCYIEFLNHLHSFTKLSNKAILFVQETEIIRRGYTLLTVPIARLEQVSNSGPQTRHCIDLRRSIYHRNRRILLAIRRTTLELIHLFPAFVELKGIKECLAGLNLSTFCSFIKDDDEVNDKIESNNNVADVESDKGHDDDGDDDDVFKLTDGYSLTSIKYLNQLTQAHCSDLLRVICLYASIRVEEMRRNRTPASTNQDFIQLDTHLGNLLKQLQQNTHHLKFCLNVSKSMRTKIQERTVVGSAESRRTVSNKTEGWKDVKTAYMMVHSLSLHLQAAMARVSDQDEQLEKKLENFNGRVDDSEETCNDTFSGMREVVCELDKELSAGRDCLSELVCLLDRREHNKDTTNDIKPEREGQTTIEETTQEVVFISADSVPVTQDEVFEAMTSDKRGEREEADVDTTTVHQGKCMAHVLSELQSVILERSVLMSERERIASMRGFQAGGTLDGGTLDGGQGVSAEINLNDNPNIDKPRDEKNDNLKASPFNQSSHQPIQSTNLSSFLPSSTTTSHNNQNNGARPKEFRQYYGRDDEVGMSSSSSSSSLRGNVSHLRRRKKMSGLVCKNEGESIINSLPDSHLSVTFKSVLPTNILLQSSNGVYEGCDVVRKMASRAALVGKAHIQEEEYFGCLDDDDDDDVGVNYDDDDDDDDDVINYDDDDDHDVMSHSSDDDDVESDDIYHVTDDDEGFEGVNAGCDYEDDEDDDDDDNNNINNINHNNNVIHNNMLSLNNNNIILNSNILNNNNINKINNNSKNNNNNDVTKNTTNGSSSSNDI